MALLEGRTLIVDTGLSSQDRSGMVPVLPGPVPSPQGWWPAVKGFKSTQLSEVFWVLEFGGFRFFPNQSLADQPPIPAPTSFSPARGEQAGSAPVSGDLHRTFWSIVVWASQLSQWTGKLKSKPQRHSTPCLSEWLQ